MPKIDTSRVVEEVRKNLKLVKNEDKHNRDAYDSNYEFLNLKQWDGRELARRQDKRLVLVSDQLNAPVDQVVNGVRQNRPGPKVLPQGAGTDAYDAETMEGLMRRVDYENSAWNAWELATECAVGGNFGCWEMGIDYENDRSMRRRITVEEIPNPNEAVFFDPASMKRDRSDAKWAMRVWSYTPSAYVEKFGGDTQVGKKMDSGMRLESLKNYFGSLVDKSYTGWISGEKIQVVKYYKVHTTKETLRVYTNDLSYYDSEKGKKNEDGTPVIPIGAAPDPNKGSREVDIDEVYWYIVDGMEVLSHGTWGSDFIPLFPVYGRERWIGNKRFVSSLIQSAKDMQQALNYALTSACEVLSAVSKTPWVGLAGQFRTKPNQWKNANTELFSFMEYDEVDLGNGNVYTSAPQRDTTEPPINAFLNFANVCISMIQRATSIFDQSMGKARSDQSGKAIQELLTQSAEGNFHWSSALTCAMTRYYKCMGDLIQREYTADEVIQITRASGDTETRQINSQYKTDPESKARVSYSISTGSFQFAVAVGPSAVTERQAMAAKVTDFVKALPPQMLVSVADLIAKALDIGTVGDEIAKRLTPAQFRDPADPQSAAMQLQQAMQENQQLQQVVQQLQKAIAEHQPELDMKKYQIDTEAMVKLRTSGAKAHQSDLDREADAYEKIVDLTQQTHENALERENRLHVVMANHSENKKDETPSSDD